MKRKATEPAAPILVKFPEGYQGEIQCTAFKYLLGWRLPEDVWFVVPTNRGMHQGYVMDVSQMPEEWQRIIRHCEEFGENL